MRIIHVARKPPIGTVAQNIEACGIGGINIQACRVGTGEDKGKSTQPPSIRKGATRLFNGGIVDRVTVDCSVGRWPSNLILSCCGQIPHLAQCPVFRLGQQSGEGVAGGRIGTRVNAWTAAGRRGEIFQIQHEYPRDAGTAARYFKQILEEDPCP